MLIVVNIDTVLQEKFRLVW